MHTAESFMYKVSDASVHEKNSKRSHAHVLLQALTLLSWSQAARVAKKQKVHLCKKKTQLQPITELHAILHEYKFHIILIVIEVIQAVVSSVCLLLALYTSSEISSFITQELSQKKICGDLVVYVSVCACVQK